MFSGESKYVVKEKMIPKYIINDKEISSDSDRKNSVEENWKNTDKTIKTLA